MTLRRELAVGVAGLIFAGVPTFGASVYMTSDYFGALRKVDGETGAVLTTLGVPATGGEMTTGPDGLVYVGFSQLAQIRAYDVNTLNVVRTINLPARMRDMQFGADGKLYISLIGDLSGAGAKGIYRYDLATQGLALLADQSTLKGLPIGLTFGPGGDLFAAVDGRINTPGGQHSIVRLDPVTGAFKEFFATAQVNIPQSLIFDPANHLFVANQGTGDITEYDSNGGYLSTIVHNVNNPQGLNFLGDGDLVFGSGSKFLRYDFGTSNLSTFVSGYSFAMDITLASGPAPRPVPLPAAVWGGIVLIGCVGLAARRRLC